jgi:exonuclease III
MDVSLACFDTQYLLFGITISNSNREFKFFDAAYIQFDLISLYFPPTNSTGEKYEIYYSIYLCLKRMRTQEREREREREREGNQEDV